MDSGRRGAADGKPNAQRLVRFDPKADPFNPNSAIDLRFLNETFAGEHGFIGVKDGQFIHTGNQEPLRFWAVNGPPHELNGADLAHCARLLAKYGVNMVRVHPLYLAAYGAVQGSDGIVHFALDGAHWAVKPNYFMQSWTLMSPAMMGQFPAAALIYRKGLVSRGSVLAELNLNKDRLLALAGTPLPQDAALDELRLKDLPAEAELKPGGRVDPLIHYAGRVEVKFGDAEPSLKIGDLKSLVDHRAQRVSSSTSELTLDYGKGVLTINAARAQGVSGCLREAGPVKTKDILISSDLELGHIVAVSLDDQPLANSSRILLQVMSEEKPTDFQTEPVSEGAKRIVNLGSDPWLVKEFQGTVTLKRPDAQQLKWTALDYDGYPEAATGTGPEIKLLPGTMYYLIQK